MTTLFPSYAGISGAFAATAARYADRTALVCGTVSLTYGELDEQSAALARGLAAAAAEGTRTPVALEMESTADAVISIVGTLRSGRPLILLDQRLPEDRRAQIATRAGAVRLSPTEIAALPSSPDQLIPEVSETDCAVILFTSGSTGEPKGVRQGHRLWLNQATELAEVLDLGPGDRMAAILPLSFGGGLDMLMTALLAGAELQVFDPRVDGIDALPRWLTETDPTTLHATPSLLRATLAVCAGDELAGIRLVTTCGEQLHGKAVQELRRRLAASSAYCNLSGSSETGNLAFNIFGPDREIPDGVLPAGRVSARKTVRIIADDGTPVAPGEIGTIVVESPYIAEGYFTDSSGVSTGDRDAFGITPAGVPLFRLGDLGRFDREGVLHLVGRRDDAVKIGGYLVEPAEVTSALLALPGIEDAVVIGVHDGGTSVLMAYVATTSDIHELTVPAIRRELREALPDWMVPAQIVVLPELPRNERGKIDRAALRALTLTRTDEPPATATESAIAALWREILGVDQVGRDDDFLALGGDSLKIQQMLGRSASSLGVTLTAGDVMVHPTVRALALHVDGAVGTGSVHSSVLVPLQVGGTKPVVFALSGAGSPAVSLAPLARALGSDRPVYGLQAHGLESRGFPDWTISRAARRYVREIVTVQPTGPYFFIGHSLGGVIAFEVARLLRRRGDKVAGVVCLDTILSGPLSSGSPALQGLSRNDGLDDETEPAADTDKAKLWRTRLMLLTAGLWRHPTQTQWDLFHDLGRRVSRLHRLRPYDGVVDVVMAEDNPDDPSWWKSVAPQVQSIHTVDGDHVGILQPPHVGRTAAIVQSVLGRVHS